MPRQLCFQSKALLSASLMCGAHAQTCQQRSEGSRRITHFYELDVQVKGMATLERSLVRLPPRLRFGCILPAGKLCNERVTALALRVDALPLGFQQFAVAVACASGAA